MSLTSSTHSLPTFHQRASDQDIPVHRQPSYITLSRTLTRLSNQLLPLSPSHPIPRSDLTAQQQATLRDLLSPLPYHRTKTLHTIEHARTLLLQLEQSAQNIKIQRVKREVVRDLAEKRKVIRKLRAVVEELGREAERRPIPDGHGGDYGVEGETVEELLGLPPLAAATSGGTLEEDAARTRTPASSTPNPGTDSSTMTSTSPAQQPEPASTLRNRHHHHHHPPNPNPPSSSSSPTTEKTLLHTDRLTQTALTDSLLTLATQLKSQSQTLSATLAGTDRAHLDRALHGLDANVAGLDAASRRMGLLARMSEGRGWWGRVMLYLWIWGLWVVAVALVFVGPKFRF